MNCLQRSFRAIARKSIRAISGMFSPARNSIYDVRALANAVVKICLNRASAEQSTSPSPDTLLRRLKQIGEDSFWPMFERESRKLLGRLGLPRCPVVAIDYRILPYYGKEQPQLVNHSELPGTTRGMKFAMLSIVEEKRTIALRVRQTTQLDTNAGVIAKLLSDLPFKPRLLLLDRGFYSTEVILALKWRKIHFLMPAPRTPGIKRACRAFESGELPATIEYRLKGRKGDVKVWLAFLRRKTKDGMQTFAFISDLQFDPKTAASFYSKRWRIETNNRELKHFLARTTTRDMKIRRIYYGLAAFLYNTWIAMRHALEKLTKWEFKKAMLKSFVCPDEENASLSPG